jgi:hypothetical protein
MHRKEKPGWAVTVYLKCEASFFNGAFFISFYRVLSCNVLPR